jgi:GMP synthase (glutamine-hydrolysing)
VSRVSVIGDTDRSTSVLVLQHAESESLGTIQDALRSASLEVQYVRTFEGQSIPSSSDAYSALIVMGGPMGVYETNRYPFLLQERKLIDTFLKAQMPILGVCLGSQLLAASLGADVRKGEQKEIGWHAIELTEEGKRDPLWRGEPPQFVAYHWHGDNFDLADGAVSLASSQVTPVQAYRYGDKTYGLLFHLEVTASHIRGMLAEFAAEIQVENLSATAIMNEGECHLPSLQRVGASVFRRWAESV